MFDIIKVLIGLMFPYLVLSLLCTLLTEFISRISNLRGKTLASAIQSMLGDSSNSKFAKELYEHHLIRSLFQGKRMPPYIPDTLFANVLVALIQKDPSDRLTVAVEKLNKDYARLQQALLALSVDTHPREVTQEKIMYWYSHVMDRVSGWYQQKVQSIIIVLGFALAIFLNIDTVLLSDHLTRGAVLREVFVATAKELAESKSPEAEAKGPESATVSIETRANALAEAWYQLQPFGLPIGWSRKPGKPFYDLRGTRTWPNEESAFIKCIGLFLTGCATVLFTPILFDFLNKFVNFRATGRSPEERPRAPRPIPLPASSSESNLSPGSANE